MPTAPPTACPCGGKRQRGQACDRCGRGGRKEARKACDDRRGTSAQRGYGHAWQKARLGYLRSHPLCVECAKDGRVTAASVVDHIVPHRGNQTLFWDSENWQALCAEHHNAKTGRGE